ncbi:ABC-three component system middle component 2 [Streptosporangium roseum]|uniref:ABC-three component system middle component 2 n=1 Tax=Streptosporangium roseum TaxID=2001 RepID=UPI0018CC4EE5|nr:ABC-three component system middle component 2 [Streptosporangium roseum]
MTRATADHSATRKLPVVVPEHDTIFRLAQLVLLMDVLVEFHPDGAHLERLGAYDFLAANPLLMASAEDDPDRLSLQLAGFDDRALSYASPAQRFATRRERLQHDLALLIAYGLVATSVRGHVLYRLTDSGRQMARDFTAMYARSYKTAASVVISRLRKFSDKRLRESLTAWTRVSESGSLNGIDLADITESQGIASHSAFGIMGDVPPFEGEVS